MSLILLAMTLNHITNPWQLNITIKDIVEPKPKRTKKILNYILVFWTYYLQKCSRFHAIEKTFEEDKIKAENLVNENHGLDEKYNDMLTVLKNMDPSKDELLSIISKKEDEVTKLKMECDSIASEYEGLKSKEANIRSEISSTDVRIATAKQTIEELDQLILSSPDRINTEIKKLEDKVKAEDAKIKEFENKLKDAEKKLQFLEECKLEEEKDLKALKDLNETVTDLRETVKKIVYTHKKIEEEEGRAKRLQRDLDRKDDVNLQLEQKFTKITLSSKKQIEALREVLKMSLNEEVKERRNVEFLKTAVKEMQEKLDSESDCVYAVIAKCKEAEAITKEKKTQFMSKMKAINFAFKSDCDQIQEKFSTVLPYSK